MSFSTLTSFIDNSINQRMNTISTCHSAANIRKKSVLKKNLTLSTSPSYLNNQRTIDTTQSIAFNRKDGYQSTLENLERELSHLERKRSYDKIKTLDNSINKSRVLTVNKTETNLFNKKRTGSYCEKNYSSISEQIRKRKEYSFKKEINYLTESLLHEPNSNKVIINPPIAYTEKLNNNKIISKLPFNSTVANSTLKYIKYCSPLQKKQIKNMNHSFLTKAQNKHSIFLPRNYPLHYNHKTDLEKFMMDFKSYSKGV